MDDEYIFSPGRKINDINEIYKGDGINTCKYCGNTGWMHTWSNDGYFYSDAPVLVYSFETPKRITKSYLLDCLNGIGFMVNRQCILELYND